jgi:hypothetical protein
MKKILVLFVICFVSIQFVSNSTELVNKDKIYYWFSLKIGKSIDKETKSPKLVVKKIGKDIESGTYEQFIVRHKTALKTGLIIVGPFNGKIQAQNAMYYYHSTKTQKAGTSDSLIISAKDSVYYYYLTRPVPGKWLRPTSFQRIPARIGKGTPQDYKTMLQEGLTFQFLAIGPFMDYALAEKSKFIFRKNGEPGAENSTDSIKPVDINEMSKKWKSVKLEMLKLSKKKYADRILYRLKIKFPNKYFIEDAFQTLTIRTIYSDSTYNSDIGITFQGDYVMDNNEIIPFDKLTTFTQSFSFNVYKKVKLEGFYIDSFIFDDTEMIEQETRFVKTK